MGPIDWDDLRFLLAASRACSVNDLAREEKVDATTVGRRLKSLEAALNVSLFVRARGRLEVTEQARHLLAYAERMEEAELGFRMDAHRLRLAPEGTVRISAPPTLARYVLAPSLPSLAQRHPGLSIELDVEPANVRVERWEADIAVRLGPRLEANDTVLARKIGRMAYGLFGPADQPMPQRWIAYPHRFSQAPEAQWVERELSGTAPALRVNDPVAIAQAVASGLGRAVLPELMATALPTIVQQGPAVLHREVWLLRHPELGMTQLVQAVCDWLVELARERL